jgi:uncharacterized protein (TIGR03435 family)
MTMAQFADQLQGLAGPYVHYPVADATGLEGGWDFSFTYSPIPAFQLAVSRNRFAGPAPEATAASDPIGGTSLFLFSMPQRKNYTDWSDPVTLICT